MDVRTVAGRHKRLSHKSLIQINVTERCAQHIRVRIGQVSKKNAIKLQKTEKLQPKNEKEKIDPLQEHRSYKHMFTNENEFLEGKMRYQRKLNKIKINMACKL